MNTDQNKNLTADAVVIAIQEGIVHIQQIGQRPLVKNEIIYICPKHQQKEKIMAEILHVKGKAAVAQVFEETSGIAVGDKVLQTGEMLSVTLGPGLLGTIYDGLQNPLVTFGAKYGYFLPRGMREISIDPNKKWLITANVRSGDIVNAGSTLGIVQEGRLAHKIMVPFDMGHDIKVEWIQQGTFTVDTPIARLIDNNNNAREVTLMQRWPVRYSIGQQLLKESLAEREYPNEPMITTLRLIDTFFPIARGGTVLHSRTIRSGKNCTTKFNCTSFKCRYCHNRCLR